MHYGILNLEYLYPRTMLVDLLGFTGDRERVMESG